MYNSGEPKGRLLNRTKFYTNTGGHMRTKSWTRPDFQEVTLGCEINCYAPAEL
jgi:coenzyme PQQ precursor peptide PqqA